MAANPPQPPAPGAGDHILDQTNEPTAERSGPLSDHGIRPSSPKTVTLGDFRILRKVGAGSSGAVYLAFQQSHGRHVALKILGKNMARRPAFVERFALEAAVLEDLDHPGIVRSYGVGEEHGFYYFAMEFVDGVDVAALLRGMGGKLTLGDALLIVLRCAEALGHAHESGVIHRDVKPENILLSRKGVVKITDLGLAKLIDEDLELTKSRVGMGTPDYVAPEQARDSKRVTQACDIYGLGGVLYRFLTGAVPFAGGDIPAQIEAKERGEFVPASERNRSVPRACDRILARMLAPDPARRYPSCTALAQDLERLGLAGSGLSFDLSQLGGQTATPAAAPAGPPLEVLLIYDDLSYVPLAQRALQASAVASNLMVAEEGKEAEALMNKVGRVPGSPKPNLIIVGLTQPTPRSMQVLAAIAANPKLRRASLCAVSTSPEAADLLRGWGLEVSLWITGFDDLGPLEDVIRQARERSRGATGPASP